MFSSLLGLTWSLFPFYIFTHHSTCMWRMHCRLVDNSPSVLAAWPWAMRNNGTNDFTKCTQIPQLPCEMRVLRFHARHSAPYKFSAGNPFLVNVIASRCANAFPEVIELRNANVLCAHSKWEECRIPYICWKYICTRIDKQPHSPLKWTMDGIGSGSNYTKTFCCDS